MVHYKMQNYCVKSIDIYVVDPKLNLVVIYDYLLKLLIQYHLFMYIVFSSLSTI